MKNVTVTTIEKVFIQGWIRDFINGKIEKSIAISHICGMFECNFFEALNKWNEVFNLIETN